MLIDVTDQKMTDEVGGGGCLDCSVKVYVRHALYPLQDKENQPLHDIRNALSLSIETCVGLGNCIKECNRKLALGVEVGKYQSTDSNPFQITAIQRIALHTIEQELKKNQLRLFKLALAPDGTVFGNGTKREGDAMFLDIWTTSFDETINTELSGIKDWDQQIIQLLATQNPKITQWEEIFAFLQAHKGKYGEDLLEERQKAMSRIDQLKTDFNRPDFQFDQGEYFMAAAKECELEQGYAEMVLRFIMNYCTTA